MYGVHLAHKIGDLVRITNSRRDPIISSGMLQRGSLGVVVDIAKNKQEQLADVYSLKDFEKDLDNCKHPGHLGELVTKKKDWLDKLPEGDKNKARNLYTQREDQMRSLKEGKFLNE